MIKKNILPALLVAAAFCPVLANAETLLFQNTETTGQSGYAILEASPDSSTVFAINNSATPGVERFSVNTDGTLASDFAVDAGKRGLQAASGIAFSPDADVLLLGNDSDGARLGLYAFSVGAIGNGFDEIDFVNANGGPAEAGLFDDINVTAVAVSPDGNSIYVAGTVIGSGEGVIAMRGNISYLPGLGRVEYTPLATAADERFLASELPAASSAALIDPQGIAVTNEGLYVISSNAGADGELVYFDRNSTSGVLSFNSSVNESYITNPVDIFVATIDSNENIFIADASPGSIIQFEQVVASAAPSLRAVYSASSDPAVTGLTGVSKILINSRRSIVYAAATGASAITSFSIDTDSGLLNKIADVPPVVQGGAASNGGAIDGIASVDLLAFGGNEEYLYATSSSSAAANLASFTRQSSLSLAVEAVNRGSVQPGQLVRFGVTLTNQGPADAPGFLLILTPSHTAEFSIDSDSEEFGSCELTSTGGRSEIRCEGALLPNEGEFSIEISMRPTRITTASVSARAVSGNQIANSVATGSADGFITSESGATAAGSDTVKVGSPNNGTLAIGLWAHLLLLTLFTVRRFRFSQ